MAKNKSDIEVSKSFGQYLLSNWKVLTWVIWLLSQVIGEVSFQTWAIKEMPNSGNILMIGPFTYIVNGEPHTVSISVIWFTVYSLVTLVLESYFIRWIRNALKYLDAKWEGTYTKDELKELKSAFMKPSSVIYFIGSLLGTVADIAVASTSSMAQATPTIWGVIVTWFGMGIVCLSGEFLMEFFHATPDTVLAEYRATSSEDNSSDTQPARKPNFAVHFLRRERKQ